MKLTFEQIKSITKGAARITNNNGKVQFYRFTEEQENVYLKSGIDDFHSKSFSCAGIRLEFFTSSRSLSLKADISQTSKRTAFCHSVYVNGEHKCSIEADLKYVADKSMTVEGSCALGEGTKKVTVYFPWSVCSELISLELDNGASLTPVKHKARLLFFGDSITHGYFADDPALSYASRITDALDAEARNKGIGGEVFRAELSRYKEDYTPDIITVAYGSNDWSGRLKDAFEHDCAEFYKSISELYPTSQIFALAPIWRGDFKRTTRVGEFSYVAEFIRSAVKALPNVTFIDCFEFVPHSHEMFAPDLLHPNDKGFEHYADRLIEALKAKGVNFI